MSDDLPELTPEQIAAFNRAAATLSDTDFSPEDVTSIRRGWLALTKERAFQGKGVHYEQPAIRGQPPRGSFRLGRDVLAALGHGDPQAGGCHCRRHVFGRRPTTIQRSSMQTWSETSAMAQQVPAVASSKSSSHGCAGNRAM